MRPWTFSLKITFFALRKYLVLLILKYFLCLILYYFHSSRNAIDNFLLLLESYSSRVTLLLLKYGISVLYTTLVGSHFGYQILRPVVDYVTTVRQMMHFLLRCEAFKEMRKNNFIKFNSKITNFDYLNDIEK